MKFDKILNEYVTSLHEQPDMAAMGAMPPGPPAPAPPAGPDAGANVPMDGTEMPEPEKPLTPEGELHLWEMIRKALAFQDHQVLSPEEKGLFEQGIDQDNFLEVRQRIESIFRKHIDGPLDPSGEGGPGMDEL